MESVTFLFLSFIKKIEYFLILPLLSALPKVLRYLIKVLFKNDTAINKYSSII